MRVTSHCANHPSRDATVRCRSCGHWLCDRCARRIAGHIYCGLRCRLTDLARRLLRAAARWLGPRPGITLAAGAALVALLAVGPRLLRTPATGEPGGESASTAVSFPTPVPLTGELTRTPDGWRLTLLGEPGWSALVVHDGLPRRIVTLDEQGRGLLTGLELTGDPPAVELIALPGPPIRVEAAHAAATPTPTSSATATPTATPTATVTATPEPSPTPSPTPPSATATPTPGVGRGADGRIRVEPLQLPRWPTATPSPTPAARRPERAPAVAPVAAGPPVLHLVSDGGPRIAITFDGSSSTDGTANLLDLLQELDLEVTLFVTGEFIAANPGVIRRALLAGHEVGSHSYSHPRLTTYADNRRHDLAAGVDREMLHAELRRTEEAFRRATGRPMAPLWRAPFGEENPSLRAWALELGYLHVRWSSLGGASLDSLDWIEDEHSGLYRDSRRMMARLLRFPRLEGGIVLMHLSTRRTEPPWEALPDFVAEIRRRGLEPTRVTTMLEASPTWRPWFERATENHRRTFGPALRAP